MHEAVSRDRLMPDDFHCVFSAEVDLGEQEADVEVEECVRSRHLDSPVENHQNVLFELFQFFRVVNELV